MFNLEVDFGNNIIAEDCDCDKSWKNGTIVEVPYQWIQSGNYEIRARFKGEYEDWNEWSEPYIVSMSKIKSKINMHKFILRKVSLFQFLENYFNK
jgi:hypothetical protein